MGGAIAACDLPRHGLQSSVAPFILRGVCLLGIDFLVMCRLRRESSPGSPVASDLDPAKLSEHHS